MNRILLFLLASCCLMACEDPSEPAGTPEPAGGAGVAQGTGGAATGGANQGNTGGAVSGTGGAGTTTRWTKEATADWLLPLHLGAEWTYKITAADSSQPIKDCKPETQSTAKVTGTMPYVTPAGTTEAVVLRMVCSDIDLLLFGTKDALSANMLIDGGPASYQSDSTYIKLYRDGTAHEGMKWSAVPSVTVSAGTFLDCWRMTLEPPPTPGETYERTYCPGVGMVEFSCNGPYCNLHGELTSYR